MVFRQFLYLLDYELWHSSRELSPDPPCGKDPCTHDMKNHNGPTIWGLWLCWRDQDPS